MLTPAPGPWRSSFWGRSADAEAPRPRPAADEAECGALCDELLEVLFAERNMVAAFNLPYPEKRKIVREYMNRRFPAPVPERFLAAQDKLFWTETLRRGVEEIDGLRYKEGDSRLCGGHHAAERRRDRQFRFGGAYGVLYSPP